VSLHAFSNFYDRNNQNAPGIMINMDQPTQLITNDDYPEPPVEKQSQKSQKSQKSKSGVAKCPNITQILGI
jgi:hypothetical protein